MAPFLPPPDITSLAAFVSRIPESLQSEVESKLQDDRVPNEGPFSLEDSDQIRVVRSTCDALNATINDLDAATKKIDALKDYVNLAKTFATQRVALCRSLMSPIRKLPNEVLQLIFIEVHAQSTEKERQNPITAQVCKFWRQVAEAIPTLWTEVNVNLEGEDALERVAQMNARIKRAKKLLVAVEFSMPKRLAHLSVLSPSPYSNNFADTSRLPCLAVSWAVMSMTLPRTEVTEGFIAIVTTLLKHRDQVGSLQIPCYDPILGDYLATRCTTENATFKNLHTFSLYEDQRITHTDFDTKPLLKACPNIIRLRIFEPPVTPHVPWEKIKAFKGLIRAEALSELVSRGRNIEQAEVTSSLWSPIPNITFSERLTALSLHDLSANSATWLATVPPPSSLRYLSFSAETPNFTTSGLLPLIRSWGSNLESLALVLATTANALKDTLQSTPKLQCLRLASDRATPPNLFTLVPNLTHLEICGWYDEYTEPRVRKLLARPLARSSHSTGLPLRSVAFLPGVTRHVCDGNAVEPEDALPWLKLARDLLVVGIQVHEYRPLKTSSVSCRDLSFSTAFFQERKWCF